MPCKFTPLTMTHFSRQLLYVITIVVPFMNRRRRERFRIGFLLIGNLRAYRALNLKPLTIGKIMSILLTICFYVSQTFFSLCQFSKRFSSPFGRFIRTNFLSTTTLPNFIVGYLVEPRQLLSIADCHRQNANDKCFLG